MFDAPVLEFGFSSVHSLILVCAVCGLYCLHGFSICDPVLVTKSWVCISFALVGFL